MLNESMFEECLMEILDEAEERGLFDEDSTYSIYNEDGSTWSKKGSKVVKSKEATRNWLQSMAALAMARSKGDADYAQLVKASRKRKMLIEKINKKYRGSALQKAKKQLRDYKGTSKITFDSKTPSSAATIKQAKHGPNASKSTKIG